MNEYFVRDKFDKWTLPSNNNGDMEEMLLNVPVVYRMEEKYIFPQEKQWEERYYSILFGENRERCANKICKNYFEGLEWVYKYYTDDCPDWKWKYNYHYPPLFVDLYRYFPKNEHRFFSTEKIPSIFSSTTQLCYVLPYSNLYLLPSDTEQYIKKTYSELYPLKYDFQWAFCRYFWEAHPLLPEISLELLEQIETL